MTMGYDPELFVVNKYSKMAVLADLPTVKTPANYYGNHWTLDGFALEVNVSPFSCRDYNVPGMQWLFYDTVQELQKRNLELSIAPTVRVKKTELLRAPADRREFGCAPSVNAYTLEVEQPTLPEVDPGIRFSGGHIHNSSPNAKREEPFSHSQVLAAIVFDLFAVLPMVGVLGPHYWEGEDVRRQYYGRAGSFRNQPHGIEYRALSAQGFLIHPVITYWMLNLTRDISNGSLVDFGADFETTVQKLHKQFDLDVVQHVINTHDYEWVWENWAKYYKNLLTLRGNGYSPRTPIRLMDVLVRASAEGVTWPKDFYFNWGLPEYRAVHHNFWGDESAAHGVLSPTIFPQGKYAKISRNAMNLKTHPSEKKVKKTIYG